MTNNKAVHTLVLSPLILSAVFIVNIVEAQAPVTTKAYAVHTGQDIQYHYQVTNQTRARNVTSVSIGNRGALGDNPATTTNEQPELSVYPTGSYWGPPSEFGDHRGASLRLGGVFTFPQGWRGGVLNYEETTRFSVDWNRENQTVPGMIPGQTFAYGVTVPIRDPSYLTGHFTVRFAYSKSTDEGPSFWDYTGQIELLDTTPPVLSITATPSVLWPPNDKLVPVTVTVTAKDDYDPQPEIKLESITANEPLGSGDIADAQPGADDRQFQLKSKRDGGNMAGRVYTVTYSATDASGNKATATATVTVPHDQGKLRQGGRCPGVACRSPEV